MSTDPRRNRWYRRYANGDGLIEQFGIAFLGSYFPDSPPTGNAPGCTVYGLSDAMAAVDFFAKDASGQWVADGRNNADAPALPVA